MTSIAKTRVAVVLAMVLSGSMLPMCSSMDPYDDVEGDSTDYPDETVKGAGGSADGIGGTTEGTGGSTGGTGGSTGGTGGLSDEADGLTGGTGGSANGAGGSTGGTGGFDPDTGGSDSGTGGFESGTGGFDSGTGGFESGTGGWGHGAGGSGHVSGHGSGNSGGTGGSVDGSGGSTGGSGGSTGGSGGSTGGSGGSTGGSGGSTGGSGGGGVQNLVIGLDGIAAFDSMSQADRDALSTSKVFFYHMSVGENLVMGHNNWSPPWKGGTNALGFVFGSAKSTGYYGSGALGHDAFGQNGNPFDKITRFRDRMLSDGFGSAVETAGFKFCYNDLTKDSTTNVDSVKAAYQSAYQAIEAGTSGTSFFHITTPLQPANQYNTVDNNKLRISFAAFLRETYAGGRHVVLDLQEIESTTSGGETCKQNGTLVLCSEWAADNDGHLTDAGATRAAKAFLYAIHVARGL